MKITAIGFTPVPTLTKKWTVYPSDGTPGPSPFYQF